MPFRDLDERVVVGRELKVLFPAATRDPEVEAYPAGRFRQLRLVLDFARHSSGAPHESIYA
jgi:hypothetical protein